MPTISEPQGEHKQFSLVRCRDQFIAGECGETTFRVSLRLLGLCPMDIDAEVNLAKMERRAGGFEQKRMDAAREWLESYHDPR